MVIIDNESILDFNFIKDFNKKTVELLDFLKYNEHEKYTE